MTMTTPDQIRQLADTQHEAWRDYATWLEAQQPPAPVKPPEPIIHAEPGDEWGSVRYYWLPVTGPGTPLLVTHGVVEDGIPDLTIPYSDSPTSIILHGLPTGVRLTVLVDFANAVGHQSAAVEIILPVEPPPPNPVDPPAAPIIEILSEGPAVEFRWTQPPSPDEGPDRWRIGLAGEEATYQDFTTIPAKVTLAGPAVGAYDLVVSAINAGGQGVSTKRVTFTAPPPPPSGGWPAPTLALLKQYRTTVTGAPAKETLRRVTGKIIVAAGDSLEGVFIDGGHLYQTGRARVIRNVHIRVANTAAWATMYGWVHGADLVENVTIEGGSDACFQMANTKVRNVRLIAAAGGDGAKVKSGLDIEHAYVEIPGVALGGAHADGMQTMDGSGIRIYDVCVQAGENSTSGLMIAADTGPLRDTDVGMVCVLAPPNGRRANIPFYFWKSSGAAGSNIRGADLWATGQQQWNAGPVYNTIGATIQRASWAT